MTEKYKLIKSIIIGYADKIGAPQKLLPEYGILDKKCQSYIEIDQRNMIHYVVRKNRFKVLRTSSPHLKHILFNVFDRITFLMALEQMNHESISKDELKLKVFDKQKELLAVLNEEYANLCQIKDTQKIKL